MSKFDIMETTVAKVQAAYLDGSLTCRELCEQYIARIKAYDHEGPAINSIICVNPRALEEADAFDAYVKEHHKLCGPLHGIPVMLKDNFNTTDMPTTAGSIALEGWVPEKDAFVTKKLREAGALILAKTNLHEFAIWGETISSVMGQSVNPYDPTRTPGGSSGGTGYNSPDGATFDVGIVRVPANNSNPLYVTQGPTMTFLRSSRNSDEENDEKMRYAWQFAKFITNPVVNDYLCIYGSEGYLPVRYSAYETNEFLTFMEEGETYAESAKVLINDIDGHYLNTDVFVGSAQLREQIGGALTQALLGSKSVTTALDDAIATAATYIK